MFVDFLLDVFRQNEDREAVVWRDRSVTYGSLLESVEAWARVCTDQGVAAGAVVSLEADFSPNAVALLLALVDRGCIVVPLMRGDGAQKSEFRASAEAEWVISVSEGDRTRFSQTDTVAHHELLVALRQRGHPGLIFFSSGSTGKPKAIVHDCAGLLEKFKVRRHSRRLITFLLFDHLGGINTLLYSLSNAGCVITVGERSPDAVCRAIERHRAEILPTSPTFLNLLLISEAHERYDLSSLKLVTYGTEAMPESTLKRFAALFPSVALLQTYGLSEVGVLRSQSKSSDSLWVRVGGEGVETRIVDGMLEIKAQSAMLGYLNAASPFTEDGWFKTGDAVEVDGEYIKILGRSSDIINVGGEKVYPAEVESVLHEMDGVEEVVVSGEPNAITGQMVTARLKVTTGETVAEVRKRLRAFCQGRLPRFKIPQKLDLVDGALHGERFKKMR